MLGGASKWPFRYLSQLLRNTIRIFAGEGFAALVAVLANAEISIAQTGYDNWDGGTDLYSLYLQISPSLHSQLGDKREEIERSITEKAREILRPYQDIGLEQVFITPKMYVGEEWRDKAKAWVAGKGVTNQGRVRSDNVAPKTCDGLLFRSQPEIYLYRALKAQGVSFAPLPVFIRGGKEYRRIEPDFVILKDGMVMVVEVDGDTVHQETPAEAHARTTMLVHEGAHVERVKASECSTYETAKACATNLVNILSKLNFSFR